MNLKYYDGFGKDVTDYVQELEQKANLLAKLTSEVKVEADEFTPDEEGESELTDNKLEPEKKVEVEKKPSRRTKVADTK